MFIAGATSTGAFHEGLNFAAVQNLGLVLIVENNLWAYSTPADMQFRVKDLAERAIGYGIPGVIVDGTDACQVYDACHEACESARRGEAIGRAAEISGRSTPFGTTPIGFFNPAARRPAASSIDVAWSNAARSRSRR